MEFIFEGVDFFENCFALGFAVSFMVGFVLCLLHL